MELRLIESTNEFTHLALVGRLDIAGVGAIDTKFTGYTSSRQKTALVDVSAVTLISSLGIRLLLSAAKSLEANGARLVLIHPHPSIREALKLSAIDQIIPIAENKDDALGLAKA